MVKFSSETVYQVWNDQTGERIEVGHDLDGLELVEIRSYTDDGKITQRITVHKEQISLLIAALKNFELI